MNHIPVRFTDASQTVIYGVLSFVDVPPQDDQGTVLPSDPRYHVFYSAQDAGLQAMLPKPI
ncbi:MAG: hypothetical protein ACRYG5_06605 [Janthinobacterium lividum]